MTKKVAASYGKVILATMSQELTAEFGHRLQRLQVSGEQP